jgi:hypothetical protein
MGEENIRYSLKIGLRKGVETLITFGLPFFVAWLISLPTSIGGEATTIGALTVGALLRMLVNWLKIYYKNTSFSAE